MIRFDPSLFIDRLVVQRQAHIVYDERFHLGVNVIRGENSSGKSTILNFIYYALGGELLEWSEVALLCSRTIVEVRLSGMLATLSREVSNKPSQPMEIFGGSYQDSLKAPRSAWMRYPYKRSASQESFSQALFRLLKMPEVLTDTTDNITIHQILRLLYADQLSPVEDLFRFERFEQNSLRDTIGRLLCGAYDSKLYNNDYQIRILNKSLDQILGELTSLYAVFGKSNDMAPNMEWIDASRHELTAEIQNVQVAIEDAERSVFQAENADKLTLTAQNTAFSIVQDLQGKIGEVKNEIGSITLNITDSDAFIWGLEAKVESLKDSASVANHFGDIRFQACPACYAVIDGETQDAEHACHLCKTPFDRMFIESRISGMINEYAVQIRQSKLLQERRHEHLEAARQRLSALQAQWKQASKQLASLQRLPSSAGRDRLRDLQRRAGYLDRQIEDLERQASVVTMIGELGERRNGLNDKITRLRAENEALAISQQQRLAEAYTRIANEVRSLLKHDLRRQDAFESPESISFTFEGNKISVDGQTYFSASSRAILKNSFCLGFLVAAAKSEIFRHPRFCMIDTMENMGVEPLRSHNFQVQIKRISSELPAEHQIIYATAMIAPELEDENYTVGRYSTLDEPTIAIKM